MSSWASLRSKGALTGTRIIQVDDPPSRYSREIAALHQKRREAFIQQGGAENEITRHGLFASHEDIIELAGACAAESKGNVAFDLTCFPKRFFFPICRLFLRNQKIANLIVTYSQPRGYATTALAENFQEWRALPLFSAGADSPEILVVSVGHHPMGLPDEIEHGSPRMEVKLLFPFPNAPESFQRTLRFVQSVESSLRDKVIQIKHTSAMDASDAFDHISVLGGGGRRRVLLAPYGPKPISLAMCIYATLTDSPVFYTQPRTYNPAYTEGVNVVNGVDQIFAYCLRVNGTNYYSAQ